MYLRIFTFAQNLTAIDCHGGDMKMYHCARENTSTTDFSWAQNCVSDNDGSRAVSGSEFQRAGPQYGRRNFFVHIALSYSTRWRDCLALLNAGDSVWQLLRQGDITRRGRWVLTDVNTCIRARTSCTLSSIELAASARGRECQQWCGHVAACAVWYAPLNLVHFAMAGDEQRWQHTRHHIV